MHADVVADAVMRDDLALVALRDEPHAAVFERRFLQRNPDAHGVVLHLVAPVGLVLVPWGLGADAGWLHDRVLAALAAFVAEELFRDGKSVGAKESLRKVGRILHRVKD